MDSKEIKVGSDWVGRHGDICTVKYIGESKVFIKWKEDGSEGARTIDNFTDNFKPKTVERVVWINVYDKYVLTYPTREMADSHAYSSRLFCQRVVIKDNSDE